MTSEELEIHTQNKIAAKIEESHQNLKKLNFESAEIDLRKIDEPVTIPMTKTNETKMMPNPIEREDNKYMSLNEGDWSANRDVNIRLKDNPLAFDVLSKGSFDLKSKDINVVQIADSLAVNAVDREAQSKMTQISLGTAKTLQKDSISLKDVDVDNIPKHLTIDLDEDEKEILIIGYKVPKGGSDKATETEFEESQNKEETIEKEIFIEKTFNEIKSEQLGEIEKFVYFENLENHFHFILTFFPLLLYLYFSVFFLDEFFECVRSVYKIDVEQLKVLNKMKQNKY